MNLPDVFKKLPYQDDIILRARQILRKIMPEDNWFVQTSLDEYIYPTSDISRQWSRMGAQAPCTGTDYDMVDDIFSAPDDDVTYVLACVALGLPYVDHYGKGAISSLQAVDIITNVRLLARAKILSALEELQFGFYIGTTDYYSAVFIGGIGQPYQDRSQDWTTDPSTGLTWTKGALDALSLKLKGDVGQNMRATQFYMKITFKDQSMTTITQPSGRVRFERAEAGAADHEIGNTITSEDWSDYTHLRFKIEKVTYAGTNPLKVGIYGTALYSVDVGDYCSFDDTTTNILCVIPLADFVALGADLSTVEGVAFTADGDDDDYDFYIDDLEGVALTDEGNDEYEAPVDKTIKGFADVGTGVQVPAEMGEVTERSATFYIPKDTIIDKDDRIVYNDEVYIVTGINDSYDTHLLIEAVLLEVWDESNLP